MSRRTHAEEDGDGEDGNGDETNGEDGNGEEVAIKGDSPHRWTRDGCEKRATVTGVPVTYDARRGAFRFTQE